MAVRVNKSLMYEIEGSRETPLVLSIQSHVIHGYVGNKVAVLLLQLLGIHVDFINSVQYISQFNHNGTKTTAEDLTNYVFHMRDSNLTKYSHILTGFVGGVEYLRTITKEVKEFKEHARANGKDEILWVCDPVLGDRGEIYTAPGLLEVFRDEALTVADIITPNHFELMWLTGRDEIKTLPDVISACDELHAKGVGCVVVTSVPLEAGELSMIISHNPVNPQNNSFIRTENPDDRKRYRIDFEDKAIQLYGTGDLIASSILASIAKHGLEQPQIGCLKALHIVQSAIEKTIKSAPEGYTPVELDIVTARREMMDAYDFPIEELQKKFELVELKKGSPNSCCFF